MKNSVCAKLLQLSLLFGAGLCRADIMYLTAGDNHTMFLVDVNNQTVISKPTGTNGAEYAIAVTSTNVDLQSAYNISGYQTGSQYDLNGNPTGVHYTNTYGSQLLDGTTDGTNFYTIAWDTGDVVRFDQNWANPQVAFSLGAGNDLMGITYDPGDNALWIASRSGGKFYEYSLNGSLITSFSTVSGLTALALDPTNDTLWAYQNFTGNLYEYSDTGTLLGSHNYSQLTTDNILGAEFSMETSSVPEPVSVALLGTVVSLLGVGFSRRSRRRQ